MGRETSKLTNPFTDHQPSSQFGGHREQKVIDIKNQVGKMAGDCLQDFYLLESPTVLLVSLLCPFTHPHSLSLSHTHTPHTLDSPLQCRDISWLPGSLSKPHGAQCVLRMNWNLPPAHLVSWWHWQKNTVDNDLFLCTCPDSNSHFLITSLWSPTSRMQCSFVSKQRMF